MDVQISSVIGLLILIADVWAILNIVQSTEKTGIKLLWVLIILLLPFIGLVAWFFLGPRDRSATV